MKKSVLLSAVRKAHITTGSRNSWGGCFTPSEIVALVDSKIVVVQSHDWCVKWARMKMKEGVSNPSWFYFCPRKEFYRMKGIWNENRGRS